ncbi:methyltransferase domain-containing protein [Hymenobacter sp. BT18]|uniref:class I SAM-dependent methyltransferase n=1 Tax=Hymenobacter sp. BT18 TaxID=2835648 RepID=UPI00143E4371|nr:methyltransferase domain-containing protein [Hymenobacter sp. BT18]QIX62924.1 methyltransferase domain-containing protein [Hymenobacter sp. BT18]
MARIRKPAEGVWNIVRFNWQFYALAAGALCLLLVAASLYLGVRAYVFALAMLLSMPVVISLLVSYYVYDYSGLYSFDWLTIEQPATPATIVNIHAGFDETSHLLREKFPLANLRVFDFYDPALHTELSIRRARVACAPFPGTESVQPHALPLTRASADWVFVLLSAHEIRQPVQRVAFLKELRRVLQPQGKLIVVEHLRDPANFMAYTIGFLHFYSRTTWLNAFQQARFQLLQEKKITPFVSAFTLQADGTAA